MTRLPYFKFMVDDWLGGMICTHDMATQGVFINLCARAWKNGGYLENDEDKLARVLRVEKQMLSNCLSLLKRDGLVCQANDGLLHVKFLVMQLGIQRSISAKRSKAGRKGGLASGKQLLSKREASSEPDPDPDPEPDLKQDPPPRAPQGAGKQGTLALEGELAAKPKPDPKPEPEVLATPMDEIRAIVKETRTARKSWTQAQKTRVKVTRNSPMMIRVGKLHGRRETTRMSLAEAEALSEIEIDEAELCGLETLYSAKLTEKESRFTPKQHLQQTLNNWGSEVDKARAYCKHKEIF